MSEHTAQAKRDAYKAGRYAVECDGFMATEFLDCQCGLCIAAYYRGWNDGDPFDFDRIDARLEEEKMITRQQEIEAGQLELFTV